MKFISFLCLLLGLMMGRVGYAQSQRELDNCQALVMDSETEYDAAVYDNCFFNNLKTVLTYWAPLAKSNNWRVALFEIYRRQQVYPNMKEYLYQSAKLGYAPAQIAVGDELFAQKRVSEAMRYYNLALHSEELSDESHGQIIGRLSMLYADSSSPYFDMNRALPLLKKAALERQALPNNLLGALSLFGEGGMSQNAEEAFKYFWRAILLGCPAAEENLGFFLMAKDKYINNATLKQEIWARALSCDAVPETSVGQPPYHLTFTAQQCADINYYAQRLVDTSLPFTGKTECDFSADMGEMADLLAQ